MNAPVVIFAYKRADHLEQTVSALKQCVGCEQSDVYIFSDGFKGERDKEGVCAVREYLAQVKENHSFKSLTVVESPENKGLAKNVIGGVTAVIGEHKRVIVIEDDTVVVPHFLTFMNRALDFYKDDPQIFSIGGFLFPLSLPADYPHDIFYTQRMSSCCWATWQDRWEKINWDMPDYTAFRFNPFKRRAFNRWGNDRASMLDDQMNGRVNSWAIRFDYTMWKTAMFNVFPTASLAVNIGMDGSGTHGVTTAPTMTLSTNGVQTDIRLEKLFPHEDIRREFCKNFTHSRRALVKRYLSNLLFRFRRK